MPGLTSGRENLPSMSVTTNAVLTESGTENSITVTPGKGELSMSLTFPTIMFAQAESATAGERIRGSALRKFIEIKKVESNSKEIKKRRRRTFFLHKI